MYYAIPAPYYKSSHDLAYPEAPPQSESLQGKDLI